MEARVQNCCESEREGVSPWLLVARTGDSLGHAAKVDSVDRVLLICVRRGATILTRVSTALEDLVVPRVNHTTGNATMTFE